MKYGFLHIAVAFAIIAIPLSTAAQDAATKISDRVNLTISHPDGRYAAGEEIVFEADAKVPTGVVAEVFINGLPSRELSPGKVNLPAGKSVVFSITPEAPASVILRIFSPGNKADFSDVGAVSAPELFQPRVPMPRDMRRFWDKQIRKMRKVPMQAELTPAEVPGEDGERFEAFAVEINCPAGNPARGYLVRPRNAAAKSLPIVMFLHSAGVSKPGNRASVATALRYAKTKGGAIALDINAHGYPDDMPQAYYDSLQNGPLNGYLCIEASRHEDFYYYGMFLRNQRALDYLCTLPEWDGKRVLVTGASQGGIQGAAIAGMDRRVTAAVLTVPGFIDGAVTEENDRLSCTPRFIRKYGPDNPVTKILPYYDAANFLKMTKAKLLVEAGLVDFTCPPGCVIGGFNDAVSEDKTLLTSPFRPHSNMSKCNAAQVREWRERVDAVRNRFMLDYLAPAQ